MGEREKKRLSCSTLITHIVVWTMHRYMMSYVMYRLHRMRKKLKDEIQNKKTVQEYLCPNCGKRYTALDALQLIASPEDEYFCCESCNGELVADSDNLAAAREMGNGPKDMLRKLEEQLKPLVYQLGRVKDLPVPARIWKSPHLGNSSCQCWACTVYLPEVLVERRLGHLLETQSPNVMTMREIMKILSGKKAAPTGESYKANDLNVEAGASGDDEDDVDWEEG
ncbi:hypothetical protein RHMOL_Rhmol05G0111000 [Rhododendron molle]|uniref:Uncharacterized protein n=1 Tax=Rhododendron molle TaxID=49168 RepID=A0ACC0NNT4_RHOML|nr:hypothetical protein RHMOL_Rhmol05G0111000 [Rhododendron molle]